MEQKNFSIAAKDTITSMEIEINGYSVKVNFSAQNMDETILKQIDNALLFSYLNSGE